MKFLMNFVCYFFLLNTFVHTKNVQARIMEKMSKLFSILIRHSALKVCKKNWIVYMVRINFVVGYISNQKLSHLFFVCSINCRFDFLNFFNKQCYSKLCSFVQMQKCNTWNITDSWKWFAKFDSYEWKSVNFMHV